MQNERKELGGRGAGVYEDGRYVLGQKNGEPYLTVNGKTYLRNRRYNFK